MNQKVVVIGLDGADWNFINELFKENELQNLMKLSQEGVKASFKSTIPPHTPTAWASIYTGVNPGKHGIFNWVQKTRGKTRKIISSDIKMPKIWEYLSEYKLKSIINGLPLTYPPEKVNGVMLSGWDRLNNRNFIYPKKIINYISPKEIKTLESRIIFTQNRDFKDYRSEFLKFEEENNKITIKLMKKLDWNLAFIYYAAVDDFNHMGNQNDVKDAYLFIDTLIGEVIKTLNNETPIIVISDHGSKRCWEELYINQYFIKKGLAKPETILSDKYIINILNKTLSYFPQHSSKKIMLGKLIKFWNNLPSYIKKKFSLFIMGLRNYNPKLNTKESLVYMEGNAGGIYTKDKIIIQDVINLLEKDMSKIVELINLKVVYHGPFSKMGPSIYIRTKNDNLNIDQHLLKNESKIIKKIRNSKGAHTENGIFICRGEPFKIGETSNLHIVDFLPTVLYILGLPLPISLDCSVPFKIFKKGYISKHNKVNKRKYKIEEIYKLKNSLDKIKYF